jgi:hypothetical protein
MISLKDNSKPEHQFKRDKQEQTPLDRSIVSQPKPVYESGTAMLPGKIWPNVAEGIKKNREGRWVVDVVVLDPYTNKNILLDNVLLEQSSQGTIQRVSRNGQVYVSIPDQRMISERDTRSMSARYLDTNVGSTNSAIPLDVVFNNFRSKINNASRNLCQVLKFDYDKEKQDLNKYDSLTIYADPVNPNSAGMYVDNTTGEMGMFNKYGENVIIGKQGVIIEAKKFNRGSSNQSKSGLGTFGLPANENEMQDLYPRSNILLNVPMLVMPYYPDFAKILYGVGFLYKMVRVGIVCGEFIKEG